MARNLIIASLLAAVFTAPASADDIFSIRFGFAYIEPKGTFAGEDGGTSTRIDFENDLDFDGSKGVIAEAELRGGRFWISGGYLPMEFSSSGIATSDIVFDGQTFTVGTNVRSEVDVDVYGIGAAYHILDFEDGPWRLQLGPEITIKVADIEMFIRDISSGGSETLSAIVPLPTIGVRARVALGDSVEVVGRAGYFSVRDNSVFDSEIQLEYSPFPLFGIYAGYRYLDVDVDDSGVILQSTFSGPYAGVIARF